MLITAALTIAALFQGPEAAREVLDDLTRIPADRALYDLVVPRPTPGMDSGAQDRWAGRLGYEKEFLERSAVPFLNRWGWPELWQMHRDDWDGFLRSLGALAPAPVAVECRLEERAGDDTRVLLQSTLAVTPGELKVVGETIERMALVDYHVQIAQAAMVYEPITAALVTGSQVALLLQPLPGGAWQAEVIVRRTVDEPGESISLGPDTAGDGQRNPVAVGDAGVVMRLEAGRTARLSLPAEDGKTLVLTLTAESRSGGSGSGEIAYVPTLARPAYGFVAVRPAPMDDSGWGHQEDLTREDVEKTLADLTSIDNAPAPVAYKDASGLFVLRGEHVAEAHSALIGAASARGRAADLIVDFTVSGGADGARSLGRFAAPAVVGVPAAFTAGRMREVLTMWDAEVAQGARLPEPVFRLVEDGVRGTVRVEADAAGGPRAVYVDLHVSTLLDIGEDTLRVAQPSGAKPYDGANLPALPAHDVRLEYPRVAATRITGTFPLNGEGQALVRRSVFSQFGSGAFLEVRIQAR